MSQFYLSNPLLKSAGVPIQFTEPQLDEYIKCKVDPLYFIENYVKIISLDRGMILFKLHDYQKRFITALHENRMVISMQSRQMGKTQAVAAYLVWYLLFNDDKTVAILANKAAAAREIMSRMQLMIENLPMFLQQGVTEWNKGSISFENNSKAFTAATSSSGIRGRSVNLLYVDEVAIVPNTVADEFFTATYPTISSGKTTKIILTSTPLGLNHFWKFWTEAEQGINGFVPVKVDYWEHPDRDEKWAEEQKKLLGELKYRQEVLCTFLGSAATLIDPDAIQRMAVCKPVYSHGGLDVFQKPVRKTVEGTKDHVYVIVADTAKGVGGDYSAFQVIDVTTVPYIQVAKFRDNKMSPMLYPNVIHKVAKEYNEAYVLIEINSSEQVAHIFYNELEYENILFVTRSNKGQIISGGFGAGKTQLGVVTDKKVKRTGCSTFKSLVEEGKFLVHDVDTIAEISTFIEHRDSFAADDGYHDDLVMPLVLFGWLTTNPYFKDLNDVNIRHLMYQQKMEAIESEMVPIGFYSDGTETPETEPFHF
jgi:hypothetical protein